MPDDDRQPAWEFIGQPSDRLLDTIADLLIEQAPPCVRCGQPATHTHDSQAYCEECRGCYDDSVPDEDHQQEGAENV